MTKDFVWSFDENYGNCYTFNAGFDVNGSRVDLKKSMIGGSYFGLQVTLYINTYEKPLNETDGLGAIIRIGNSSYSTDSSYGDIYASPSHRTFILVEREFKEMLPKPYSNCEVDADSPVYRADSDLYNLLGRTDYAYSQQLCLSQCVQKQFITSYNCSLYYLPSLFNVSQCDLDLTDYYALVEKISQNNFNQCLPLCPIECNQTLYKTSLSFYQLNGHKYIEKIRGNPNLAVDFIARPIDSTTVTKSVANVNVFYERLTYTLSKETSQMDVVSLLASVGGNLSLFLGVSIFSLGEMVEACIEMLYLA